MKARACRPRRGFVLLPVLWVIAGVAVLGAGAMVVARDAVAASRNRMNEERAEWRAEGCLEQARAAIDEVLHANGATDAAWKTLDRAIGPTAVVGNGCEVTLVPVGLTLDINAADARELREVMRASNVSSDQADSLVDALLDWRDPDASPRQFGAEKDWYARTGALTPRDASVAAITELAQVRGFDTELAGNETLRAALGTEPGRILLSRAPLSVIASLPGIGNEVLQRIATVRATGGSTDDLETIASTVSAPARAALLGQKGELDNRITTTPDAWILTSRATAGEPKVVRGVEVRMTRAGSSAAIIRRRSVP